MDTHAVQVGVMVSDVETKHGFPLNTLSFTVYNWPSEKINTIDFKDHNLV